MTARGFGGAIFASFLVVACAGGRGTVQRSARARGAAGRVARPAPAPSARAEREAPLLVDQRLSAIRVRFSGLSPDEPARANWRQGGEGLGGAVRQGELHRAEGAGALSAGEWSSLLSLQDVLPPGDDRDSYFTLTAGPSKRNGRVHDSKGIGFEIEQLQDARVVRSFASADANGTLTLFVPGLKSTGFVHQLSTVGEVADARRKQLEAYAGVGAGPLPRKYAVVSDLGGYGETPGYGVRVGDAAVVRSELGALMHLGVTGLRAAPDFLLREGLPGLPRLRARIIGPVGYPTPDKRREPDAAGCPFDPGLSARSERLVSATLTKARAERSDSVWVLTQDEIGAVTDLAAEGKMHLATCPRCRAGFVRWLREQGLTPRELDAVDWEQVRPLPIWDPAQKPWLGSAGLQRRAYLTKQFLNVASASMFTPLRDELGRYNAAPRTAEDAGPKAIYSYALRGNTFLTNGSSLDFFEFYRHADNAVVWETSDRDARSWGWDAYLMDVQRVLGERLGIAEGIYIKPQRGAPIQRALSAAARGNSLIYWYTYGPDYWKGDAFSGDHAVLEETQRAARLLGAAEPWLYGAKLVQQPRVAIVKPETTSAWAALTADPRLAVAALENAKWVYTALQHAHVPVDPLDEYFLNALDLSAYAAIYVNGSHLTTKAAAALARYVKSGGTLVTSGGGLQRDEADGPLRSLDAVFGVKKRAAPTLACSISTFRSVRIDSLSGCPEIDRVESSLSPVPLPLVVGKESLEPLPQSEVLARYRDGSAAMLRHAFGRGTAYLLGTFAGLEYAAPVLRDGFDMRGDLDAARRRDILEPIRGLLDDPVACSDALVEPQLLKSPNGTGYALTLVNWAYAATDELPEMTGNMHHVRLEPSLGVQLLIKDPPPIARVYSAALERELPFASSAAGLSITLERLEQGDVLHLE